MKKYMYMYNNEPIDRLYFLLLHIHMYVHEPVVCCQVLHVHVLCTVYIYCVYCIRKLNSLFDPKAQLWDQ